MHLFNYSTTSKPHFVGLFAILLLFSCRKPWKPQPAEKVSHLLKIIDWEAAERDNTDTVPQYTVEYSEGKIIALHGVNNDCYMRLNYEKNTGSFPDSLHIPDGSRIIRESKLIAGNWPIAVDTFYFSNNYTAFRSLVLGDGIRNTGYLGISDSTTGAKQFIGNSEYGTYTSTISVQYDADGDIIRIKRVTTQNLLVVNYDVTINFSSQKNNLHKIENNLSLCDPSCLLAGAYTMSAPDLHVNTFPFSIHYQSKCVSSYKIERSYGESSDNTVNYQFDKNKNISKIFINGKPFKEFVYEDSNN